MFLLHLRWRLLVALLALVSWSDALAQLPSAEPPEVKAPAPETGLSRWFNPETAPFIPVPLIGADPDSGTTLGILPTWIVTNQNADITRIIAPDINHNPDFGWGAHGRIFAYPSEDEQWSVMAGLKEHVEREFDGEFQYGRARRKRWSFNASIIYDRDGTPRFFGLGNRSAQSAETNYTSEQEVVQLQAGYNISKIWQILYTARARQVDVQPGTLAGVPSIQELFPHQRGIGRFREALNRISLVYNTMDDLTVPSHGMKLVEYTGIASRAGLFNDSLYTEAGFDGRGYFPVNHRTIIAAHLALRYLLSAKDVPFWALSSLGGDQSEIGGEQLLRGPVLRPQLAVHERRDTPAHRLLQRGLHPRRSGDRPVRGSRPGLRAVEHHALRRPAPCLRGWIPGHRETVRRRLCRRRLWQQRGGRVHRDQLSVLGVARSAHIEGGFDGALASGAGRAGCTCRISNDVVVADRHRRRGFLGRACHARGARLRVAD